MFLTSFIGKRIVTNQSPRCLCVGVAVSLKSGILLYLLCSHTETDVNPFALPASSIHSVNESCIVANKFRPCICKRANGLFLGMPAYSTQGKRLGELENGEIQHGVLTHITVGGLRYNRTQIRALMDAILLTPSPVYPIGQPVPVPHFNKKDTANTVTKAQLKKAVENHRLIQFTLSLPPFSAR